MSTGQQYVLSGELVAQLITDAATLSRYLRDDLNEVASRRDELRDRLLTEGKIIKVRSETEPLKQVCAVDGAHLPENDRALTRRHVRYESGKPLALTIIAPV